MKRAPVKRMPVERAPSVAGRRAAAQPDAAVGPEPRRPRRPELDIPPEATPDVLDRSVLRELRSLPKDLADRVARHLAAAGLLVDDDPEHAYRHAAEARRLAARLAAVREAAGLTAYAAGHYGEALTDLRAARRLADNPDVLPVIADCERGLGRPERALELAAHPDARRLDQAGRVELLIVTSGARRDMGQPDAAVLALETPELRSGDVADWTPRLWYAYADALLAAGRRAEAAEWFAAAAGVDDDDVTDAGERAAALDVAGDA